MGCCAVGRFTDEEVRLLARDFGRNQVSVIFAGVVAGEHDFEAGDFDKEHGASENVAGMVGGYRDANMGEGGVIVDGFDARVGGEMIGFGIESFRGVVDVAGTDVC